MAWKEFNIRVMKNRIYQYCIGVCLGLCVACHSGISWDEDEVGQAREVTFRISQADNLLARATATSFEIGDSIGIYAVKRDAPEKAKLPSVAGNQAHNAKWIKTKEGWIPASLKDKIVFTQDGSKLDFYAYYPYSRNAENPEKVLMSVNPDQRAEKGQKGSDWMAAFNTEGVNEGEVNLVFKHLMASVVVEVRASEILAPNEELQIQMTNILLGNRFDLGMNVFAPVEETAGTIDMKRQEEATEMNSFTYKALLPAQTLKAGTPVFRCLQGGKIYIYHGEEIVLERGNCTRFIFTLKSGGE